MKKSLIVLATTAALTSSLVSTSSFARGFGGLSGRGGERPVSTQAGQRHQQEGQQQERRRGPHNEEQRLLRLTRLLNLSDAQVEAIKAIHESNKDQVEDIKEAMKVARESLAALSQAETFNEEEVALLAAGIGGLVTELIILKSKGKFDLSEVLTAEQKAKLEEMRNAFSHRHGDRAEDTETS